MSITGITNKVSARIAAGAVGVAMIATLGLGMSSTASAAGLTQTQIQSILSLLQSFGADQGTINNVNAALNGQATTGTGSTGGSTSSAAVCPFTWTRTLQVGSNGSDVKALQQFLNGNGFTIAASGAGSMGNETMTFGPATKAAVMKFQTANGISAIGVVGPATRAKVNGMCGGTSTGSTGSTGGSTGTTGSVSVGASTQPANSLAPQGTSRVPFTTFTLTNNSSAPVTVNSVTVQRSGLGQDAVFSGIVLLDQNGLQVGIAHTLNSNHQANVGDSGITLQPGQTQTFTVAGNMAASLANYAGQVVSLQVVAVNTSAAVAGSLPITGAAQTINATLSVGSVSTSTSSIIAPTGTTHTQNIGDTAVRLSGLKFTAGSTEDLKLYSIRWRQVGSVSSADISNVMTYVNGTAYPTTVDATGKYYTSIFPGGILIQKGNSADAYVQGDITGANAAGRTVQFTIDKVTDVYFVGQLYGYGIAPSGTFTPWYNGDSFSVNAGTATTINKANEVAAQNIPVNVQNTVLGGFATTFAGEPVSVQQMVFNVATTTGGSAWTGGITSVSIVDENGRVVAGPVDANTSGSTQTLTFTDTVTFATGRHVYTLKGKVPTGVANNSTIVLSTTPSSQWTNVTGQVSGNTISLPSTVVTMNTMTVQGATTSINVSNAPASQNIVPGVQNFVFANFQIDASQSGEDIRMSSLPVSLTTGGLASGSDLSGCQIWNGNTALTTGSHVINTVSTSTANTFSFDNTLTVPKGTVTTLSLSCNLSSSAQSTATYQFGINGTYSYSATGVTSGNSITPSVTTATGGTMTASAAKLNVSVDASSPSYAVVSGGTTGVTVGVYKMRASNEALNLTKLGLTLTNSASSSAADLTQVYIYSGSTLVGTATFTGTNTTATSTLTTPVTLAKDQDTLITVKADFSSIGTSQPGTEGHLVAIDPINAQATGASSGSTVNIGTTSGNSGQVTAGVAGIRTFKSYPTLALDTLPSTGVADGRLIHFKVTADSHGNIGVGQFTFSLATTTASVTNVGLYAYTDAGYSSPVSGQGTSGQIGSTQASFTSAPTFTITPTTNAVQVPAGSTVYFELRGSIAGVTTGASVVTTLKGDASYPSLAASTFMGTNSGLSAQDFVWTPNATTTQPLTANDFTNGYGLPGLPASGLIQTRSN